MINTATILAIVSLVIYVSGINQTLFLWLQGWGRYVPDIVWASLTLIGDALTAFVLLLLFARKYPQIVWAAVPASLVATVVVQGLKNSLVLPRPPLVLPPDALTIIGPEYQHASFPSGHSAAIWVFVGVWLFSRYSWRKLIVLFLLASLVALSRVMVGAHWPVDITSGALIGWLSAWAGVMAAKHWHWGMTINGQRIIVGFLLIAAYALIGHDSGYTQVKYLTDTIAVICLAVGGYHLYMLFRYPQRTQGL